VKFCWFTTGEDKEALTLLQDVHSAMEGNVVGGDIALIFVNRDRGESPYSDAIIAFAEEKKIPLELLSSKTFLKKRGLKTADGREAFDLQVRARIEKYEFDSIFLAGYRPILSPILFERFPVFSLHPSLPDAHRGRRETVISDTINDGKRAFGAMIHVVDAALVGGQPLSFVKLVLEGRGFEEFYNNAYRGDRTSFDHLFNFMREAECAAEIPLVIETLSSLSRGTIALQEGNVCCSGKPISGGIDMTNQVLSALRAKSGFAPEE
jgi:folate-dependent phosphoribosylglycinamide formyltransferase PurN